MSTTTLSKKVGDLELEETVITGINDTSSIQPDSTELVQAGAVWNFVNEHLTVDISVDNHIDQYSKNPVENQAIYHKFYNLGISGGDFVSVDLDQNSALDTTGGSYIADGANIYLVKSDSNIVFDNTNDDAYYRLRTVQFHSTNSLSNINYWNGALKTSLLNISHYKGNFQYYDASQDRFLEKNISDIVSNESSEQWTSINNWINAIFAYKDNNHPGFIDFDSAEELSADIKENGFICLSSNDSSGNDTFNGINNILTLYRIPHDTPVSTKLKDINFEYVGRSNPDHIVLNTISPFIKTMDFDFTDQNVILDPAYDYVYVLRTSWDESLKTIPLFSEESMKSIRWSRYMMYKLKQDIIDERQHTNLWLGQATFDHSFDQILDMTLDELKDVDASSGEANTNAKYIIGANFNVKVEQYTVKFKTVATKEYVDNRLSSLTENTDDECSKFESMLSNVVDINQIAKTADYLVGTEVDGYRFNRINGFYGFTAVLSSLSSSTDIPNIVTDVKIANSSTDTGHISQTANIYCNIWKYSGSGEKTNLSNWKYITSSTNFQNNAVRFKNAGQYMDFKFDRIALDSSKLYLFQLVDSPTEDGNALSVRAEILQRIGTSTKEYTHDDVNYIVGTTENSFTFNSVANNFPLVEFDGLRPAEGFAYAAAMMHGGTSGGSSGLVEIDIDSELNETSENPVENKAIFSKFQQISTDLSVDAALNETSTHAVQNKVVYKKISELEDAIAEIDPSVIPPHYDEFEVPVFSGKQYTEMLTSNVLDWPLSAATMDTIDIDMSHSIYPMLSVVHNTLTGGNAGNVHTTADVVEVDYTESYLSSAKFRIPTVIQTNSGRLIAAYDIRWNSANDIARTPYTDQCTGFSYSDNGGKTWSKNPAFLMGWYYDDGNGYVQSGVSDPSLLYDDENDVVFCFAIAGNGTQSQTIVNQAQIKDARRTQLIMSYSIDNGETWSKPEIVTDKIFDSDGITQSWICTADNPTGKFGFIFGCCSNGIRLKHQQNSANNGLALAIQLWPTNGLNGTNSTRCTFAHFYPTYQTDRFGNKKATAKFVLTEGLIGETCNGAHEGQIAENENGTIAYFCKSMTTVSNVCLRIFTTTDCGKTWTCYGNTAGSRAGDKVFSQIANTPTTRVKPSIAYSDYMHRWFISYSNHVNRSCPTIRYADGEITDSTIWKIFDVCDSATQDAGYTNLISLNNGTSIGMIYESHLDSCHISNQNSKSFMYNSYSFLPKVQTQFSSTWREIHNKFDNADFKALSFTLEDFTDAKFVSMKTFAYRGRNAETWSTSNDRSNTQQTRIALYDSDENLIVQNGHKAISYPLNWKFENFDKAYPGRKYEFIFEYPVMLKAGQRYYIGQYIGDNIYNTYSDYKNATTIPYFTTAVVACELVNGSQVGIISYNGSFNPALLDNTYRYSPLCWISSK